MEDFVVMAIRLRSCQFFDYFIDDSQAAIKLGRSRDILKVVRPKRGLPRETHNKCLCRGKLPAPTISEAGFDPWASLCLTSTYTESSSQVTELSQQWVLRLNMTSSSETAAGLTTAVPTYDLICKCWLSSRRTCWSATDHTPGHVPSIWDSVVPWWFVTGLQFKVKTKRMITATTNGREGEQGCYCCSHTTGVERKRWSRGKYRSTRKS
jgi:hypothetical protein